MNDPIVYQLQLHPNVEKNLRSLPEKDAAKIERDLDKLKANPRPRYCEKLAGQNNTWRIRCGDYRVIYEIHDKALLILILKIAQRGGAYKK